MYDYIDGQGHKVTSCDRVFPEYQNPKVNYRQGDFLRMVIQVIRNIGIDVQVKYKESRSVDVRKIILDNSRINLISNCKVLTFQEGIKNITSI